MNYTTYANKIKQIDYDISALVNTKKHAKFKVIGNDIDNNERPEKWPYHTGYIHAGGWLKNINADIKIGDTIYQNNLKEVLPEGWNISDEYWKNFILSTQTSNIVFIPFFNKVIGKTGSLTSIEMDYLTIKDFFPYNYDKLNYSILYSTMQPNIYDLNFEIDHTETSKNIPINFNYAPMLPFITEAVAKQPDYFRFNDTLSINSDEIFSTDAENTFTIKINKNIHNFNQVYLNSSDKSMSFRYHYIVIEDGKNVDKYLPNIAVYSNEKWIAESCKEITDPVFLELVKKSSNSNLATQGELFIENYETLIIDNNFSFDENKKPFLKLKTNSPCDYLWLWR